MKCLKCGRTIDNYKCPACGFDFLKDEVKSLVPLNNPVIIGIKEASFENPLQMGIELFYEKNYHGARECFKEAVFRGSSIAKYYIGLMYLNGNGVICDYSRAFNLFSSAAREGNPAAEKQLGDMYFGGIGIKQNNNEALKWYKKAAEKQHVEAQRKLGWLYESGKLGEKNYKEALLWFEKAGKNGSLIALIEFNGLKKKMQQQTIAS